MFIGDWRQNNTNTSGLMCLIINYINLMVNKVDN